jgi:hypothetical protein
MAASVTEGDETHLPDPSIEENISRITLWSLGTRRSHLPHPCDQEACDD